MRGTLDYEQVSENLPIVHAVAVLALDHGKVVGASTTFHGP